MDSKLKNNQIKPKHQIQLNRISVQQLLNRLFAKYDRNGDGRLNWFQFTQIIQFLSKVTGTTLPTKYDIKDIFYCIDKDGDNTVSKEQYTKLIASFKIIMEESGINLLCKTGYM